MSGGISAKILPRKAVRKGFPLQNSREKPCAKIVCKELDNPPAYLLNGARTRVGTVLVKMLVLNRPKKESFFWQKA